VDCTRPDGKLRLATTAVVVNYFVIIVAIPLATLGRSPLALVPEARGV
jgi:hypothetical protein